MDWIVSIMKDGKSLSSEVVTGDVEGDITEAIGRVFTEARRAQGGGTLWPCQIDVRAAD